MVGLFLKGALIRSRFPFPNPSEAEKASPADAARAIVAGIIAGDEEIFPDRMSQGTGPAFFADPKGLERQVAGVQAVA